MSVVSAFLVPGSPLPYVQRDNPPWGEIADAMETAGKALAASDPEPDRHLFPPSGSRLLGPSSGRTRADLQGLHVDEKLARVWRPAFRREDRRGICRTGSGKDRRSRHQGQRRGL